MKYITLFALVAMVQAISHKKYDGDLPPQFDSANGGDPFMEKVIRDLATKDDKGQFWVSKEGVLSLAHGILTNQQQMHSFWANLHIDENFEKCWRHFDFTGDGKIPANQIINFYKMLAQDNTLQVWWENPKPEAPAPYY